jgi:hypothetical protein
MASMMRARSSWVVLVAMVLACSPDERDSGIYSSSAATFDDDDEDDEVDESESAEGESTTSEGDTNDDTNETTTSTDEADDDTTSTTSTTTESESEGNGACGNGVIDGGEQCDGSDLGGMSCIDLGYTDGVLACDPTICVYDTSGCTNGGDDNANECNQFCNGCTCPSPECTMCCAQMGKVDTCGGGMCGCF